MAVDPVPAFIAGSQVDGYVLREMVSMATRGSQGIQLPTDMKVTATGSPSGGVNVAAGSGVLRNAQAAGQSYVGRVASTTFVPISPTSGSPRSDLIVVYVKDPDFSPWTPYTLPNDILFGPYFYADKISGVSGATTAAAQVVSYSAYELARIDIPSSTTNITNAMIHDLRQLAQPRIGFARAVQAGPTSDNLLITDTSFRNFPTASLALTIPVWATHMVGSIRLLQVQSDGASDFNAQIRVDNGAGGVVTSTVVNFDYNGNVGTPVGFVEGIPFEIFGDMNVSSLAGQTVTVSPRAARTFTSNTGNIWYNNRQQIVYDFQFTERVL
jgi:hypothetical protein